MPKPLAVLLTAVALLAALGGVQAAQVANVTNVGDDGDGYYRVRCTNGARASVVLRSDPPDVCIFADHLGRTCNPSWTLEAAAALACRSAPGKGQGD
jgi:hypothetical protein